MGLSVLDDLEKKLERLERLMKIHNPDGHGFDAAFGHRGGSGGTAANSQEAFTPSYLWDVYRYRFSDAETGRFFSEPTTDAQEIYNYNISSGAGAGRVTSATRTNDVFYTLNVNYTPNTSASRDNTAIGVATDGTSIWACYVSSGVFKIDKGTLGTGNLANQTIAGANAPPNTAGGSYLMGLLSSSRMAIWHQGTIYWGDISGSTITFSDTPTTLPAGFTLNAGRDANWSDMASDGAEYIIVNPVDYNSNGVDRLVNVLVFDDTGTVSAKYLDIWIPGGFEDGSQGGSSHLSGIVKIVNEWCPIFPMEAGTAIMCQSWELAAHTDDS